MYFRSEAELYEGYDQEECPCCVETQKSLDNAEEYFDMLVKMLHSKEQINPYTLGNVLEELRAYCGFKTDMPAHLPTVHVVAANPMTLYSINKDLL